MACALGVALLIAATAFFVAAELFYQLDPQLPDGSGGWKRSARCWGHAVSEDLVHWVDWPVAIWPDSEYDRGGVYSGNTVIDQQVFPCALYTGNVAGHRETYGMLARSSDGWLGWQQYYQDVELTPLRFYSQRNIALPASPSRPFPIGSAVCTCFFLRSLCFPFLQKKLELKFAT